ncbi:MAG: helix-turn-helix domain-containing protein [Phycisphaerales bacterium]|nr:helix-turn-helix domain-containing protein [Phycisphaerales bacterium]
MTGVEDLIGLADAAALLRVPYQKAHRLVMLGELPAIKQAGRWVVRREDVDKIATLRPSRQATPDQDDRA